MFTVCLCVCVSDVLCCVEEKKISVEKEKLIHCVGDNFFSFFSADKTRLLKCGEDEKLRNSSSFFVSCGCV